MTMRSSSGSSRRRPAALAKNALLSLVSLVIFLSIGEGLARLFVPEPEAVILQEHQTVINFLGLPALNEVMMPHPVFFWKLKPDLSLVPVEGRIRHARVYRVRFTLSTNRAGLRGPEIRKDDNAIRVLALGDSTTFGLGVNDEATWPAVLERILAASTGKPVHVINAGVPGYSAYQGLRYLEEAGVAMKPDLVLATFGFNDIETWSSRSDYQTARALAIREWERPFLHSRLYGALKRIGGREDAPAFSIDNAPRLSPEEFRITLDRIREECSIEKVPLVLLIWPYRFQQEDRNPSLAGYQPDIASFGAASGVDVVNLVDVFVRQEEMLFLDHIHANRRGLQLIAEVLAPAVSALLTEERP